MAMQVVAAPMVTLNTLVDALSLTGDQVWKAKQAGFFTVGDIINAMCDSSNIRTLVGGQKIVDLATMDHIDDATSNVLEGIATAFTPRPANLVAVIGPARVGANPSVIGHADAAEPGFWDGVKLVLTMGRNPF